MHNFSTEVLSYHNKQVLLSNTQLSKLRSVRDSNRRRVKEGLRQLGMRQPFLFSSQGSYAMRTVIWKEDHNFDIDDGVYFEKEWLVGPRGAELDPLQARELICNAVHDGSFAQKPEVRMNCVRIWYAQGYHVDMPVYRRVRRSNWWSGDETYFELASSKWKRSDARAVTDWFESNVARFNHDNLHGGQLRRIVRLLKDFAHSRHSWRERTATGFMIAALASKSFKPYPNRDDVCLYEVMKGIASSFWWSYSIVHPVLEDGTITRNDDDGRPKFFVQQLKDILPLLQKLSDLKTRHSGLAIWDKVFNTDYFTTTLHF